MNFVASIFIKGALAKRAKRLAISVLPTPVGPIINIFFGVISSRNSSATRILRQRLRNAMATERLALDWPIMCLSSSLTISLGVIVLILFTLVTAGFSV